jgi:hypothetical protein
MKSRLRIGFILIAVLTGTNVYYNQDNYTGTTEFNKYGFSFRYPSNALIWEAGFPDYNSPASDFSGRFSATGISSDEVIEQVMVIWTVVNDFQLNDTLEDALWDVMDDISINPDIILGNFSELKMHSIDDYELVYIYFTGSQNGEKFNSIIGVMILPWESLRSYRAYIFGYVGSDEFLTKAEVEEKYLDFLNSFKPLDKS